MKSTILFLLCAIWVANLTTAQTVTFNSGEESTNQTEQKVKVHTEKVPAKAGATLEDIEAYRKLREDQTKRFQSQLSEHISKNMTYSAEMTNRRMEGTVIVEVQVSKKGKVLKYSIAKSLHKAFDEAVLEAVKTYAGIKTKSGKYIGARTIQVPVSFSLR